MNSDFSTNSSSSSTSSSSSSLPELISHPDASSSSTENIISFYELQDIMVSWTCFPYCGGHLVFDKHSKLAHNRKKARDHINCLYDNEPGLFLIHRSDESYNWVDRVRTAFAMKLVEGALGTESSEEKKKLIYNCAYFIIKLYKYLLPKDGLGGGEKIKANIKKFKKVFEGSNAYKDIARQQGDVINEEEENNY